MTLREYCAEWFNNTARKDWDNVTTTQIAQDYTDSLEYVDDDEKPGFDPADVANMILEVISESDRINAD